MKTAMKTGLIAMALVSLSALCAVGMVPAPAAASEPALTIRDNEDVRLSGQVVSATRDRIVVNTGGNNVNVDLTTLSQGARVDGFVQPGAHVIVDGRLGTGTFNTPVVAARQITVQELAE